MLIRSFDGKEIIDMSTVVTLVRRANSPFHRGRTFVAAHLPDGRIVDIVEVTDNATGEAVCRSMVAVARWSKHKCA